MKRVADAYDATIHAVATSAVREAANRDAFLLQARVQAGIDVQVISGVEEARLIHLGVLQSVPVFDRQHLVVDIGGGSTEFIVGKAGEELLARSLKLGAIRVTDRFFPGGLVRARAVRECRSFLRSYLVPLANDVNHLGFEVAVGSSGTINAIAAMSELRKGHDVESRWSTTWRSRAPTSRRSSTNRSRPIRASNAVRSPGSTAKRADIIVGGALLLEQIFDELAHRPR